MSEQVVDVTILCNLNKKLHNLIRNQQGELDASIIHYDISRLFFYAFAQDYYKSTLEDLLNPDFYKGVFEFEPCWLRLLKIEEMLQSEEDVFESNLHNLWEHVLANHPKTADIFPKPKYFTTKPKILRQCLVEIYKLTKEINFSNLNEDFKGKIYEYYVNEYNGSGGRELGQYFTPRPLIKSTLHLLRSNLGDYKFEPKCVYDPCMGTAGFLTEAYREFKQSIDDAGVVYGNEYGYNAYISGYMNLILSVKPRIMSQRQDSLRDNTKYVFNLIVTNPPFATTSDYKQLISDCDKSAMTDETRVKGEVIYPIATNHGSSLFLQHCMAKLAFGGICCIVLPNGEMLTGDGAFRDIRQLLMANFYIMAIMRVPDKTFRNADIGTIVLIFCKYGALPQSIKFYECDKSCSIASVKYIGDVPVAVMAEKNYAWNYNVYKAQQFNIVMSKEYELKTMDIICRFIPSGKHKSSEGKDKGLYPLYYCSILGHLYTDTYDVDMSEIILNKTNGSGKCEIYLATGKHAVAEGTLRFQPIDENVMDIKYLYYYLTASKSTVAALYDGAIQKSITQKKFKQYAIPIPTIEHQRYIKDVCDRIVITKEKIIEQSLVLKSKVEILDKFVFNESIEKVKQMLDICAKNIADNEKCISDIDELLQTLLE